MKNDWKIICFVGFWPTFVVSMIAILVTDKPVPVERVDSSTVKDAENVVYAYGAENLDFVYITPDTVGFKLEEKRVIGRSSAGAVKAIHHNIAIGPNAGIVIGQESSQVFIGPEAGNSEASMRDRPLVEFTDGYGKIMFQITSNGEYYSTMTREQIVARFKPYYYMGQPKETKP